MGQLFKAERIWGQTREEASGTLAKTTFDGEVVETALGGPDLPTNLNEHHRKEGYYDRPAKETSK